MAARLVSGALDTLARSKEFKRGVDNAVYHQGYPISYRGQTGVPSVQFSVALDGRRADIDVDYRRSIFPVGLFNGHSPRRTRTSVRATTTTSTSIAGRISELVAGLFRRPPGARAAGGDAADPAPGSEDAARREEENRGDGQRLPERAAGRRQHHRGHGLRVGALYACLAQDSDNPADFDRGVAPFQLMINMKAAHESLGPHSSLDGLVVGTRLSAPGVRVVRQPHHATFVIYAVPDDAAVRFDCESRLTLEDPDSVPREYGNYAGATFYIAGQRNYPSRCCGPGKTGLEDRVVEGRSGGREGARARTGAGGQGRADQRRPHLRRGRARFSRELARQEELRRRVWISLPEEL